jgi:hypothetical protein
LTIAAFNFQSFIPLRFALNFNAFFQNRFRFFLPRFGIAKVETFSEFANFIFYYFKVAFLNQQPAFRFRFGGLQRYEPF